MIALQILKIIGIVIAAVIGLVIVLLLMVLFVPVRYKVAAKGENADIDAQMSVGWLLGLAKAVVKYREKKVSYRASVAGIRLLEGVLGEDEVAVLKEALEEEEVASDPKKAQQISKELKKAEEKAERAEEQKAEKAAQKEQEKEEKKREKEEANARKKEESKGKSLKEKVQDLREKINEIRQKYETAKRIWKAKATKRALSHLKVEIFHILNHMKPRTIAGSIRYGLNDPANTALIYGNAAPLLEAAGKGKLIITPDFYKQGINLDLTIKGRFFIGYMVLCLVRLYLDRDIQKLIKVIRRFLNG